MRRAGASPNRSAPLPPFAACNHKSALSLSGFGYSSRLRALLLCGAHVVHVAHEDNEFFVPAMNGSHWSVLSGGRNPMKRLLLPKLKQLRKDDDAARQVALAGQRFARRHLAFDGVLKYIVTLLESYARLFQSSEGVAQSAAARRAAMQSQGYVRVAVESDLLEITGMCDCGDAWDGSACGFNVAVANPSAALSSAALLE